MTNELINTIIGAISGAISGGLVNLFMEKRRERREDKKEETRKKKEVYEKRPELDIIKYENNICKIGRGIKENCDINIFLAKIANVQIDNGSVNVYLDEEHLNDDEWCCVIYKFKNKGKTDIQCVNPICNIKKSVVLYDVCNMKELSKLGVVNYSTWYEKKVRVGECFTMKVCYHKDSVMTGTFSAIMDMGLEDDNGRYWLQSLFVPEDKIYNARNVSHKEYINEVMPDIAIECFKKPWLW